MIALIDDHTGSAQFKEENYTYSAELTFKTSEKINFKMKLYRLQKDQSVRKM